MANRTTLADGSTSNRTQIVNIAHMFIKPQNESLPIMQKYKVDYVIVYVTFNPNTGSEWAYGDNAKWTQMARIAGYNLTDFYVYDSTQGSYSYTTKFTNSTIANLMYGIADKAHFTLVHQSETGWVLVYKVTY